MDDFHLCPESDYYRRILLPVSYSVAFVGGLGLNGALLWVSFCRRHQERTWSGARVYVTHLAVADLLYVLTLPPVIISNAMGNDWLFGDCACKTVQFLSMENLHCSMALLACVSAHRLLGVRFPVSAVRLRSHRASALTAACVWVVVTTELLPTLAYSNTGLSDNRTVCFDMTDPRRFSRYFPYGMFLCVVGFFLPFVVILFCYCAIIKTLYCVRRPSSRVGVAKVRKRSLRMVLVVWSVFMVCFAPYHVVRTVYLFVRVYMLNDCRDLYVVTVSLQIWKPLISLNCCANPLLYFLCSGRYRKKIRGWLCRRRPRVLPAVCLVDVAPGPRRS